MITGYYIFSKKKKILKCGLKSSMLLIYFLIRTIHIRCNICANSCLINIVAIKVRNSHEKKFPQKYQFCDKQFSEGYAAFLLFSWNCPYIHPFSLMLRIVSVIYLSSIDNYLKTFFFFYKYKVSGTYTYVCKIYIHINVIPYL